MIGVVHFVKSDAYDVFDRICMVKSGDEVKFLMWPSVIVPKQVCDVNQVQMNADRWSRNEMYSTEYGL